MHDDAHMYVHIHLSVYYVCITIQKDIRNMADH